MKLTIFTPVFNRRKLLFLLYQSLEKQTNKNFVWLIVDDGSTDGCEKEIIDMQNKSSFPIVYIYQDNQGKHAAHNKGLKECKTELFVCVDSDDTLLPNAVQEILTIHEQNINRKLLGYYFRKVDTKGFVSGGNFKLDRDEVGIRELYHKYGFQGELVIVLKTNLVNKYFFPVYEHEKFVSELVFYNELNDIAPMLWCDKIIYSYEYQVTGYTNNALKLMINNPYGTATGFLSEAVYSSGIVQKGKAYSQYLVVKRLFHINSQKIQKYRVNIVTKVLAVCFIPHYYKLFIGLRKKI